MAQQILAERHLPRSVPDSGLRVMQTQQTSLLAGPAKSVRKPGQRRANHHSRAGERAKCRLKFDNVVFLAPDHTRVLLFTSLDASVAMRELLDSWRSAVQVVAIESCAAITIEGYNNLLCTTAFWERFEAARVLVFQADS
jgi:hypothetical protein